MINLAQNLQNLADSGLPILIVCGLVMAAVTLGIAWGGINAKLASLMASLKSIEAKLNTLHEHERRIERLEHSHKAIDRKLDQWNNAT